MKAAKKQFFTDEVALFLIPLQKVSETSIRQLCSDSHVSTRTYAKVVKQIPVKMECYCRLLIGISRIATYEEFIERWKLLGDNFYWKYSEE